MEPSPKRVAPNVTSVLGPLNDDEMCRAASLLARAVSHGQSQAVSKKIFQSFGGKSLAISSLSLLQNVEKEMGGTMADSSKRQRDVESEWGLLSEHESECAACALEEQERQAMTYAGYNSSASAGTPMPGNAMISTFVPKNGEDTKVAMPADVSSLYEWSRTEIKLPKLQSMQLTYGEFANRAEIDAELSQYAKYLMDSFGPYAKHQRAKQYTHGVDLAHFLCRIKFNDRSTGTFRRVLRNWSMWSQLSDV